MKLTTGIVSVLVFGVLGLVGGLIAVILTGHDGTQYSTTVGLLLTTVAGFVAILRGQRKQDDKIETVKRQTNGTLTRVLDSYERAVAREAIVSSEGNPDLVAGLHEHTLGADEIRELRDRIKG